MAAIDTFDWFVNMTRSSTDEEKRKFIDEQRKYLLDLRSEDERQRFVEAFMKDIKELEAD